MDTLNSESSTMKKVAKVRRPKERNLDPHTSCVVNSCQEKVAAILIRLNYSIHLHVLALDGTSS